MVFSCPFTASDQHGDIVWRTAGVGKFEQIGSRFPKREFQACQFG
jgi:hypothetical protein